MSPEVILMATSKVDGVRHKYTINIYSQDTAKQLQLNSNYNQSVCTVLDAKDCSQKQQLLLP